MCGSATFLIEAAWLAMDRAPGLGRSFAFERWRDTDKDAWQGVYDDAEQRAAAGEGRCPPLAGNDRHPGALANAREAIAQAGLKGRIELHHGDARDWEPPFVPAAVATNPPSGLRLEADPMDLAASWRALGSFLHDRCHGATAHVLCGEPALTRQLGLKSSRKFPIRNGPIECRWLRYEIEAAAGAP
jgi:23S rRNA G2445 N2-methylase RlmL